MTLLATRMVISVGKIESFVPDNGEGWAHYVECLEYCFLTNSIQSTEKKNSYNLPAAMILARKTLVKVTHRLYRTN